MDWASGEKKTGAVLRVQTRPSVLYARLFAALGDFATGVEYTLLFAAVVFAIIESLALLDRNPPHAHRDRRRGPAL